MDFVSASYDGLKTYKILGNAFEILRKYYVFEYFVFDDALYGIF